MQNEHIGKQKSTFLIKLAKEVVETWENQNVPVQDWRVIYKKLQRNAQITQKFTPKTQISTNHTRTTQKSTSIAITATIRAQQYTKPRKDSNNHKRYLFEQKETSRSAFATRRQRNNKPSASQKQHKCNSAAS